MPSFDSIPPPWNCALRRLKFRISLGWAFQVWMPWMLTGITLGSLLHWLFRSMEQSTLPAWWITVGLGLVGCLQAVQRLHQHPVSLLHALSRLDEGWGMRQSLIRAAEGKGNWPPFPGFVPRLPLAFRSGVWSPPLLLSLLLLTLSVWIPVPEQKPVRSSPRMTPPDWSAVQTLVKELEKEAWVEPEALSRIDQEVKRLQNLPSEEWYGPASLEATDRLLERVQSESHRLQEGIRQTADLLRFTDEQRDQLSPAGNQLLNEQLQQLLQQLGEQALPLNAEQLQSLRQLDLSQAKTLSEAELRACEQRLREQGQALEAALLAAGLLLEPGAPPQAWGVDGGGEADLGLSGTETTAVPMVPLRLELEDPETAPVGDVLSLRETEHEETRAGRETSAGAVADPGESGAAVWQRDLLPAEQQVLRTFFQSNSSSRPGTESP